MDIPIVRNVLEENERQADALRERFGRDRVLVLNLISSPGSGKTSVLERTLRDLGDELRMAVIEGDPQTDNDARRVAATGARTVQIVTDGGCHLDANMVAAALKELDCSGLDVLFIENVGNLVCPVEFDCGEDAKVAILSVTEGDDKPQKYPGLFLKSSVMLLNKTDLLPYVDFDVDAAVRHARAANPSLETCALSCRTGEGLDAWYAWLRRRAAAKKAD